ncbi:MAG: hypothetical protein H6721_24910 [Sandaracinus sp.]|nr:hypothetical protein [Sandaracinus sp.]
MQRLSFLLFAATFLGGCLQSTYQIRSDELERLAQLPPEDRGERIRAVQELATRPDEAPVDDVTVEGPNAIVAVAVAARIHETRCRLHGCGPEVLVPTPVPGVHVAVDPTRGRGGRGGRGSSLGESSSGDDDSIGAAAVAAAVVATVAVAGVVVGVAATEGARHDGWVGVSMDHPVHLYTDDGKWLTVPAYAIEPELAAWADGAILDGSEGRLDELERAPLNRQGLTLGMEGTMLGLGQDTYGGGARLSAGGFPHRLVGLQLFVDFGIHDPASLVRYGGEAQVFAPGLGRLHVGAYLQGGNAVRRDAALDVRDARPFVGGGGLVQVELTTRLALQLRGGVWGGHGEAVPEVGLGLAVY